MVLYEFDVGTWKYDCSLLLQSFNFNSKSIFDELLIINNDLLFLWDPYWDVSDEIAQIEVYF